MHVCHVWHGTNPWDMFIHRPGADERAVGDDIWGQLLRPGNQRCFPEFSGRTNTTANTKVMTSIANWNITICSMEKNKHNRYGEFP